MQCNMITFYAVAQKSRNASKYQLHARMKLISVTNDIDTWYSY